MLQLLQHLHPPCVEANLTEIVVAPSSPNQIARTSTLPNMGPCHRMQPARMVWSCVTLKRGIVKLWLLIVWLLHFAETHRGLRLRHLEIDFKKSGTTFLNNVAVLSIQSRLESLVD